MTKNKRHDDVFHRTNGQAEHNAVGQNLTSDHVIASFSTRNIIPNHGARNG